MALTVALATAGGCEPVTPGIEGISCTSDDNCNAGLKCLYYLQLGAGLDGGCSASGRLCLHPCQVDTDCQGYGEGVACLTACGGSPACEPIMVLDASAYGAAESGPDGSGEGASDGAGDTATE
jgi:hypothetical protein